MIAKLRAEIFIFNYLGSLLIVFGILLLLPLIPAVVFQELGNHYEMEAFTLPAALCLLLGFFLQKRIPNRAPTVTEGMVITALAWLMASVISGVVFVIGIHKPFVDAIFEAASGLSTTGITVFEGLDTMPMGILFWRALIQWIGGLGILTFFLVVSFRGGSASATLLGSEGHKIAAPRPVPGIFRTIKILWAIYIFFTVTGILMLWFEGMTFFDALTHSFTAISTGGFSTHDASVGFYSQSAHGILIEYTVIFFMLMGGINFLIHFQVLCGDFLAPWKNFEMQWFWGVLAGATAILLVDHLARFSQQMTTFSQWHTAFRTCLFQVSSLITSTGFATKDINDPFFPALAKQVFMFLMLVGGCVGSTAGGIKMARLAILVRTLKTELLRITLPIKTVLPVTIQGRIIDDEQIRLVCALLCAWVVVIFAGAGVTAFFSDLDGWQSLSGMLSAVGNMGPFYFSVHTMAGLSPVIKWTYTIGMIAGRLEILPLIVMVFPMSWK